MFAVLLPVKEFRRSKQRLATWLPLVEREALAQAMFEDVWAMRQSSFVRDRLFVVSSEPYVIERCRKDSVPCQIEADQHSHSDSVTEATRWAMSHGVTSLLSIPIDTPAVTADEISVLAELGDRYSVVVVPSADGTGTNALLRTPPDAIAPQFGPGSCALHLQQAKAKGLSHSVYPVESLAADIDTPEDAEHFLSLDHACRTTTLLRQWLDRRQEIRRGVAVCS
ncbi:MAG: 2-phospho-L-lactate guanylyltransferase [Acidobacteria bacterium]|nr:2-phospho-L-lactate guanylyltransferase [Acidobacteriota bacterium]